MTRSGLAIGLALLATLSLAAPCSAQTQAERDASEALVHTGPAAFTPRLSLRDVGIDTNVFNEEGDPTSDYTMTIGPAVDSWLRVGNLWVSSKSLAEWVYFKDASAQRSLNLGQETRLDWDLLHVIPRVSTRYERTRRRPNLEIDARIRHVRTERAAGLEVRISPRTALDIETRETTYDFSDEGLGDTSLAQALNRSSRVHAATVRYALTPLTTMVFEGRVTRDRFEFDGSRDSDSLTLLPGLEFEPLALISGKAVVGYRRFEALADDVPDFSGVVAEVDVAYTIRDLMRATVRTARDVDYSFELTEPYYVSTGVELELTHVVGLNWDAVARAGRTALDYETRGAASGADRQDVIVFWGGGAGRHLGEDMRIGIDIDYVRRRSDRPGRGYSGLRTGGSIIYGF